MNIDALGDPRGMDYYGNTYHAQLGGFPPHMKQTPKQLTEVLVLIGQLWLLVVLANFDPPRVAMETVGRNGGVGSDEGRVRDE